MLTKSYGNGNKTLILINGRSSLSNYISTLGVPLSDKYKIIEYYQKGTPENPATNKDELTINGHLSDLKNVVEDEGQIPGALEKISDPVVAFH